MFRMFGGLIALISLVALVGAVSAFATGALSSAASVSVVAGKPTGQVHRVEETVPKDIVVFKVANRGRVTHDFRIAGKKTKSLAPGKMTTLSVVLKKTGKYAYLCTVPGHAQGGMKGVLTVK